jgi:hypothetical protein
MTCTRDSRNCQVVDALVTLAASSEALAGPRLVHRSRRDFAKEPVRTVTAHIAAVSGRSSRLGVPLQAVLDTRSLGSHSFDTVLAGPSYRGDCSPFACWRTVR